MINKQTGYINKSGGTLIVSLKKPYCDILGWSEHTRIVKEYDFVNKTITIKEVE